MPFNRVRRCDVLCRYRKMLSDIAIR